MFFQEIANSKYAVIFYESPYRIIKTLKELNSLLKTKKDKKNEKRIVVGRELTKKFETIYRGKIEEVIENLKRDKIKGEFVIVVSSN